MSRRRPKKLLCTPHYQHILYIIRAHPQIILTVALVLVGMIFLIPAITEKALGRTVGCVDSKLDYSNVRSHMYNGKFNEEPHSLITYATCWDKCSNFNVPSLHCLTWQATGTGLISGTENGYVQFDVYQGPIVLGTVTLHFYNPTSGANTCSVDTTSPNIVVGCTITQGNVASADYCVNYSPPPPPSVCKPFTISSTSNTVLEKKSNSNEQTPPSGKIVSQPHNQSQFTVNNKQTGVSTTTTTTSSTPKIPSSTSGHGLKVHPTHTVIILFFLVLYYYHDIKR